MSVNHLNSTSPHRSLLDKLQSKQPAEKDEAWNHVYNLYFPMVKDLVLKNQGTEEDATDIFQDGMIILFRNISRGSFREESTISTYLFSICRNLWLKELKQREKWTASVSEWKFHQDNDATGYLIDVQVMTLLMNELKEECRSLLIECYFNKKSMAELKDMFNVGSVQAAKNKKRRCIDYLVRLCNERGIKATLDL